MIWRGLSGGLLLLSGGCLSGPESATLLPFNPFITEAFKPAEVRHVVEAPGTKETADRVIALGGKLVFANPQIGIRPRFITIGQPKEEIFHRGTQDVFITEGLVRRCETEAQLAAVMCLELGKMVAEREAFADPMTRRKEVGPPVETLVGNDSGGSFGSPDGTRRMELYKYVEQPRHKADGPPPAPDVLAREYLSKAGFAPTELDEAAPVLKAADSNVALEKMFTTGK